MSDKSEAILTAVAAFVQKQNAALLGNAEVLDEHVTKTVADLTSFLNAWGTAPGTFEPARQNGCLSNPLVSGLLVPSEAFEGE